MRRELRTISGKLMKKNEDFRISCIMFWVQELIASERKVLEAGKDGLFSTGPQLLIIIWSFSKDCLGPC